MKSKAKILVVDDNKGIRAALEMLLPRFFAQLEMLSSPKSLQSTIRELQPDVVLLDMNFQTAINTGNDRNSIKQTGTITEICKNDTTAIETPSEETTQGDGWFYDILGRRYAYPTHPGIYIRNGQKILVH